ncbi:hypothetical protein [Aliiroseovarius sp.]|uniref:hypothetical protein n=1 Tax=Aliiroseovarius sp. TaxID=1872442 RepID=UPI003BAA0E6F
MTDHPCSAPDHGNDLPVAGAGLDRSELQVLTVLRYFLQSFTYPASQAWMTAFQVAGRHFPAEQSANLALAALDMVQAMRVARREGFRFSNPECPGCRQVMSGDERQLMGALAAARRGQRSRAHTHALILCEGNDVQPFLEATNILARRMARATQTSERVTAPSS